MKVLNKEKLLERVIENAEKAGNTAGEIYTMRKVVENAKEIRVNDNKSLVVLGSNVYTLHYDAFKITVEKEFEDIEDTEFNPDTMIKELDEKDSRINKK